MALEVKFTTKLASIVKWQVPQAPYGEGEWDDPSGEDNPYPWDWDDEGSGDNE